MGYMGFGMRKEDYQRKTKKLSGNLMYSDKEAPLFGEDSNTTQIKRERLKYQPAPIPTGLRIFRIILYRLIPLAVVGFILYGIISGTLNS